MNLPQVSNLIEHVSFIKIKYNEMSQYTGEDFNVFNILKLDTKELIHSAFIANLLNVKGNHGQKDVFLKLFLKEVKDLFRLPHLLTIKKFNTATSCVKEEEYLGVIDFESVQGGRIDIVIKDDENQIIIENKILAKDQLLQLQRYKAHYKNSPILYLTLTGEEPSSDSIGVLKNGEDYICISYEIHIKNWIENCVKEMANKPIIRETLNQYLHLIKQLTNQTTNDKMEKELIQLILKNKEAVKTILEATNALNNKVEHKLYELHDLLNNSKSKILNSISEFQFEGKIEIGSVFKEDGVKIFNLYFREDADSDAVFVIEIHENDKMNFTINCGTWSPSKSKYEEIISALIKNDKRLQPLEYSLEFSNEEIIGDILIRIELILKHLQEVNKD